MTLDTGRERTTEVQQQEQRQQSLTTQPQLSTHHHTNSCICCCYCRARSFRPVPPQTERLSQATFADTYSASLSCQLLFACPGGRYLWAPLLQTISHPRTGRKTRTFSVAEYQVLLSASQSPPGTFPPLPQLTCLCT